jgi:hypothetical protein
MGVATISSPSISSTSPTVNAASNRGTVGRTVLLAHIASAPTVGTGRAGDATAGSEAPSSTDGKENPSRAQEEVKRL